MTVQVQDEYLVSAQTAAESLREACNKVLDSIDTGEANEDATRDIIAHLVHLRTANLAAQQLVLDRKNATDDQRRDLELIRLDIQNIYYQHKHLQTEIARCRDYQSRHETMDIVSLEDLVAERPEVAVLDTHQQTVERLKHEQQKRLELFSERASLQHRRKMLQDQIQALQEDLDDADGFSHHIDLFLEGAKPLRRMLDRHAM